MNATPKYDHEAPTASRSAKSFALPVELLDEVDARLGGRVSSINDVCGEAMEAQLRDWVAGVVECVNPETGAAFVKAAGANFPARGRQGFRRGRRRDQSYNDTSRMTVRVNPDLLDQWLTAVWYQQHTYTYPSDALAEAVEARIRI